MKIKLVHVQKSVRGGEYNAKIMIDDQIVGRVERGMNQGGYRANEYRAFQGRTIIATGRTLTDLKADIREHFEAEGLPDPDDD